MNREDIIRMAKNAGLEVYSILEKQQVDWDCLIDDLQEFHAIAVAVEREACAEILLDYAKRDDLSDSDESLLKHLFELIRARGEA